LTYYAYPDHVKQAEMSPPRAPTGPILDADDYRRRFPDGRIGSNPSLASVEAGRRLHDTAVKDLSDEWTAFAA
jgi:creatinine amidohydrolase